MKRGIKKFLEVCCFTGTVLIGLAFIAFVAYLIALGMVSFIKGVKLRPVDLPADTPSEGAAWIMPEAGEVPVWLSPVCADEADTAYLLEEYTEGDAPVPEWYRPDEPMAVEWVDHFVEADEMVEAHPPVGVDPGGIDWNICSTLYGADGLKMEQWEMGLFARILYREFWGTSPECCEAGADSIINLWASGYYGNSLFDTLSAVTETGGYAFSTFPGVWEADYDPDGLAEMQSICEDRFYNGTEYGAAFFRTDHYHGDWAVPLFCFPEDNVYFSTGKGWK